MDFFFWLLKDLLPLIHIAKATHETKYIFFIDIVVWKSFKNGRSILDLMGCVIRNQ